ncbi:hypothetical protein [Xanthomonas fragariae]|uniref:hypothetical protein n=1 Tax=Xanthomonas fragariae TaxID=48664 RepID=UPI00131F39BE|nr:hypothetical protein [Xanthomonas fragariae]
MNSAAKGRVADQSEAFGRIASGILGHGRASILGCAPRVPDYLLPERTPFLAQFFPAFLSHSGNGLLGRLDNLIRLLLNAIYRPGRTIRVGLVTQPFAFLPDIQHRALGDILRCGADLVLDLRAGLVTQGRCKCSVLGVELCAKTRVIKATRRLIHVIN